MSDANNLPAAASCLGCRDGPACTCLPLSAFLSPHFPFARRRHRTALLACDAPSPCRTTSAVPHDGFAERLKGCSPRLPSSTPSHPTHLCLTFPFFRATYLRLGRNSGQCCCVALLPSAAKSDRSSACSGAAGCSRPEPSGSRDCRRRHRPLVHSSGAQSMKSLTLIFFFLSTFESQVLPFIIP